MRSVDRIARARVAHQIHQLIFGAGPPEPLVFLATEAAIRLLFLPPSAGAIVAAHCSGPPSAPCSPGWR